MRISKSRHGVTNRNLRWLQYVGSIVLLGWILGEQLGFWASPVLERLEGIAYDQRVERTLSYEHDPQIVIVDIDEPALQEYGQWPWSRHLVAELISSLYDDYAIQLLGLDVVFAEPERDSLAERWPDLQERHPQLPDEPELLTGDAYLAETLARYPVVGGIYFDPGAGVTQSTGGLPPPALLSAEPEQLARLPMPTASRYTGNLESLQQAMVAGGFFDNPLVDSDGVFRRVPLLQEYEGDYYPSLPLAMLLTMLGMPPVELEVYEAGGQLQLEGLDVGGFELPTDEQGAVLVPFLGPRNHFTYISAAEVLAGRADPEQLAGASVLLGTSAPGLMDLRVTPVGNVFPGVEIQASVLAGMLHMNFRSEPGYSIAATGLGLLAFGLLLTWALPRLKALWLVGLTGSLLVLHFALNLWAWHSGWVLPLASGMLLLVLLTGWHLVFNFLRESREKRQVADQFGRYVPPELVHDIMASPTAQDMRGQVRELTVLFSDVRNFTPFAEQLEPHELTQVMNQLLTPVTRAIHEHRGTIDKYMGDAVMAFWGAPLADTHHAVHAVRGAVAMQAALRELNDDFGRRGLPPLHMGIGLHTGPMNVGNMGSEFRMAYTVMGDHVNLGARLESLTKAYGQDILLSEATKAQVEAQAPGEFTFQYIDTTQVKGRDEPVAIYTLVLQQE